MIPFNTLRLILILFPFLILWIVPAYGLDPAPPPTPSQKEVQILTDRDYVGVLIDRMDEARSEILISMYLFKTDHSRGNPVNHIEQALENAAKRGVKIKILLEREEGPKSELNQYNEETAKKLQGSGMEVSFDSPRRRTHTKVIVVDRRYLFVGSHNFTRSALQNNHEISILIDSGEIAEQTAAYIEKLIRESKRKSAWDFFSDLFR